MQHTRLCSVLTSKDSSPQAATLNKGQGWQTAPASWVAQGHCRGSTPSSLFVPHQGDVRVGTRPSQTNAQSHLDYYDSGSVDVTLPLPIHMLSDYYS